MVVGTRVGTVETGVTTGLTTGLVTETNKEVGVETLVVAHGPVPLPSPAMEAETTPEMAGDNAIDNLKIVGAIVPAVAEIKAAKTTLAGQGERRCPWI